MDKLNPSEIIKEHLKTLYLNDVKLKDESKKPSVIDHITYFYAPLIISYILLAVFAEIGSSLANILISVFSIFVGLLLNLLVLVYDLVKKTVDEWKQKKQPKDLKVKLQYLEEIFATISYCILISVFAIIFLLISLIQFSLLQYIASYFIYFLTINFFLTLLIVLARIHTLLFVEFEPTKINIEIEESKSYFWRNTKILIMLTLISMCIWLGRQEYSNKFVTKQLEAVREWKDSFNK